MEYLDLSLSFNKTSLRLVSIYRPPCSKKNKNTPGGFFEEFSKLLEELTTAPNLVINGDFNFHMENCSNNDVIKFNDLLESAGLVQRITTPTHNRGHTLDLIIDRQDETILNADDIEIVSYLPSDHSAVICTLNLPKPKPSKAIIDCRSLNRMNLQEWKDDILKSELYQGNLDVTDVETAMNIYNTCLAEILDKQAPLKSKCITLRPNSQWFTDELRQLKRQRRRCERKYIKTSLEVHHQVYKTACYEYTTALNTAKANFYKEKIASSDQNQLFKLIDSLFKIKKTPVLPSYSCPKTLADNFNEYFCNKIEKLRETLEDPETEQYSDNKTPINSTTPSSTLSTFNKVSETTIQKLICQSKTKSCELDPIPTKLLKQSMEVIATPLTAIVNASLASGVFPTELKQAIIRPSIKNKTVSHEHLSNYRPISNIPYVSKILEKVVKTEITTYLLENDLYTKFQSAYRNFHSTETCLVRVTNDIYRAIDSNKEVILILLDLSSAFDTIDHSLLLHRLQHRYGITGTVLKWFTSYVSNRKQQVAINGTLSTAKEISTGIQQGSVLGPILFSLFYAPVEDIISAYNLNQMIYADDSQLYVAFDCNNRTTELNNLETCINVILKWYKANGLVCNKEKTDVIHLSSRFTKNIDMLKGINIGSTFQECKTQVKDLGVWIDNHLRLNHHVNNVCKNASYAIKNIGQIRKFITNEDCERLIHAFITNKLDFCNAILYGVPDYIIDKLQRIQNTAARLLTRTKKTEHITPILYKLHWLPVRQRIIFKILLLTFKALTGQSPQYISELLSKYKPKRNLRSCNANLLNVPTCNMKNYGERAFSICAPKIWNNIPEKVKNCKNLDEFKKEIKTILFTSAFNEI